MMKRFPKPGAADTGAADGDLAGKAEKAEAPIPEVGCGWVHTSCTTDDDLWVGCLHS